MRKPMKTDSQEDAVDECCSIAESIMEDINLLNLADKKAEGLSYEVRRKDSLMRKIVRQIKHARQSAMG